MSLSDNQLKAAGLLARGVSIRKTAEGVGVNKSTISTWKKSPEFQEAIQEFEQSARLGAAAAIGQSAGESVSHLLNQVERLKFKSLTTIEEILEDKQESSRIRLQAAVAAKSWCDLASIESAIKLLSEYGFTIIQGDVWEYDEKNARN